MTQNNSLRAGKRMVALAVLLMAALTLAVARPALAEQTGTISITQRDTSQTPIGGGKVAIYQVGVISGSSYQYVGAFATLGDDLTTHIPNDPDKGKVDSAYLDKLESIAKESSTPLQTVNIDARGEATFDQGADGSRGLAPGAYLVVQVEAAPGYNSFDRFLVTIPWEGSYTVDASPKLNAVSATSTPSTPSGESSTTPGPSGGHGGTGTTSQASETTPTAGGILPQTGQLWWPVAVLGVAGVAFVVAGRRANGKRAHES